MYRESLRVPDLVSETPDFLWSMKCRLVMCPWIRVGCDYKKVADRRSFIFRIYIRRFWDSMAQKESGRTLHKWGEALFLFLPAAPSFNLAVKKPQCVTWHWVHADVSHRVRFEPYGCIRQSICIL